MKRSLYEHVQFITDHPIPSEMKEDTIYLEGDPEKPEEPYFAFSLV
jgi:hypothetical protein